MKLRVKTRPLSFVIAIVLFIFSSGPVPGSLWAVKDFVSKAGDVAFVAHADNNGYVSGEIIVELKSRRDPYEVAGGHNMVVLEDLEDNQYLFGIPDSRTVTQAGAELIADHRNVKSAEPNFRLRMPEVDQRSQAFVDQRSQAFVDGQSPGSYYDQYAAVAIGAPEAQTVADGNGVMVAIIDTGVDTSHPALSGRLFSGYDYVDNDSNPSETGMGVAYGHGTMVAGVVALVAPGAIIMPIRAFSSDGLGKASKVANAIRYAARRNADVINIAFGMSDESNPIRKAIEFAAQRGAVLVTSAGNDNTSFPQFPASDENVMAVGATDETGNKADFSNYGFHVDVAAPGVNIYSAYPGGQWVWWSGTSFAAAFVSGGAAMVLSAGGGDPAQIIQDTAIPCCGGLLGSGLIDLFAAVNAS